MNEKVKRTVSFIVAFVFSFSLLFADTSSQNSASSADDENASEAVPYAKDEFPQWTKDLRRGEIIACGSLPFVLLQSTIVYSFWRYYDNDFSSNYVPNPLSNTSAGAGLDESEQKMLLATSVAISAGLGLLDFTIQVIRRKFKKHRAKKAESEKNVIIESVEESGEEMISEDNFGEEK